MNFNSFRFHNLHCAHGEMETHCALSKETQIEEDPRQMSYRGKGLCLHHCMDSASKHSRGWEGNGSRSTPVPEFTAGAASQRSVSIIEIYHRRLKADCGLSRAPKPQAEWDSRDSHAMLVSAIPVSYLKVLCVTLAVSL